MHIVALSIRQCETSSLVSSIDDNESESKGIVLLCDTSFEEQQDDSLRLEKPMEIAQDNLLLSNEVAEAVIECPETVIGE